MTIDYQTVTFFVGIGGVVFTIYNYFRNPQISAEKADSLFALEIQNLSKDLTNLKDNHIHTLESKIEVTNNGLNGLSREVTKLATIIDERIPRKNNG